MPAVINIHQHRSRGRDKGTRRESHKQPGSDGKNPPKQCFVVRPQIPSPTTYFETRLFPADIGIQCNSKSHLRKDCPQADKRSKDRSEHDGNEKKPIRISEETMAKIFVVAIAVVLAAMRSHGDLGGSGNALGRRESKREGSVWRKN